MNIPICFLVESPCGNFVAGSPESAEEEIIKRLIKENWTWEDAALANFVFKEIIDTSEGRLSVIPICGIKDIEGEKGVIKISRFRIR